MTSPSRPVFESLEDRQLCASTRLELSDDGLLSIRGTTSRDTISVGPKKEAIIVSYNGEIIAAYKRAQISRIEIFGLRGSDTLRVNSAIKLPTLIDGGEGSDVLRGGGGTDLIIGGPGEDDINGGKGDDIIVGDSKDDELRGSDGDDIIEPGADRDRIDGGSGTDILIGRESTDRTVRNIETEEPAGFLPPGKLFPVSVRLAAITAGFTREDGRTTATVQFVLPDSSMTLVTSRLPLQKDSKIRQFSAVLLQDASLPLTGQTSTITRTFDLGTLTGKPVYSFQISAPEGIVYGVDVTRTTNSPLLA